MAYQYRKLRGRIVEKFGTITELCERLGISTVTASRKLQGQTGFSQEDIEAWSEVLEIEPTEYGAYFFN